ncbi:unnamed protein product, partial [Gongylonema pulchrum]|uniref:F-box/kelch-repeat protein n=1 Tax=Gongylonema pulchrum TaxID=637853 RepID=A0A183EFI9_9BILA
VGGSVPSARAACSSTYLPAYASILVFGGRCRTERLNDLYMLDLSSLVWTRVETTEVPVRPSGRSWCSVNALSSDQALVYGGLSNDSHTLSDSWRICIKRKRKGWYEGTWTAMDIASELCGGADLDSRDSTEVTVVLRRQVEPLSLQLICLGALHPDLEDVRFLPMHLQLRCAWAHFLLYAGYRTPHMTVKHFKSYSLLKILDMSS